MPLNVKGTPSHWARWVGWRMRLGRLPAKHAPRLPQHYLRRRRPRIAAFLQTLARDRKHKCNAVQQHKPSHVPAQAINEIHCFPLNAVAVKEPASGAVAALRHQRGRREVCHMLKPVTRAKPRPLRTPWHRDVSRAHDQLRCGKHTSRSQMRQHSAAFRAYRGGSYCLCNPAWVGSGGGADGRDVDRTLI